MLFEHRDFRGFSRTIDNTGFRYFWNRYGGAEHDAFSSMRLFGRGHVGHAYAFEHINHDGRFAALNANNPGDVFWSYFGDAFNDVVSSSLVVVRDQNEIVVPLRQQVASTFASMFDAMAAGTRIARVGAPRVYGTFFPSYDNTRIFLTINQNLTVRISGWPDYDANVKYDIEFFLAGAKLNGFARWSHVWVEAGLFSQQVFDRIKGPLHAGKANLTSAVQQQLRLFSGRNFRGVYILPGPRPNMSQFGFFGHSDQEVCLVAVPQ
ncbi:hypothetical protein [Nonomuraea africana]|nr:hypothetical protein [Nonomuraea africana]